MNEIEPLIGFLSVILFSGLVILFSFKKIRAKFPPVFRKIIGANRLRKAIGLAVEDGTRLHISLGSGDLTDFTNNTSGLSALSTLDRIEQLTSTSDLPPMSTSGSGSFQILSQDISRYNTIEANSSNLSDPNLAQLPGITPFSYAVGVMDAVNDSGTSANVFIGNFGAEAGFFCDSSKKNRSYTLAGSNSIVAQSIFYALADDTLIGEELYALPAYLGSQGAHQASLQVQDIFRLLIILVLVGSLVLKLAGLI